MPRHLRHAAVTAAPTSPSGSTLLAILAATVVAAGCGGSDSPPAATAEARGQALYVGTGVNCVQCHTDAATVRRDAADAAVLADRIAAAVAANTGRMGDAQYGYATLTRAELLDLAAYLVSRAPVASTPPPPPSTWTQCAIEYGTCTFTGTREVRYGTSPTIAGQYAAKTLASPVGCENETFGDPVPGSNKLCWYAASVTEPPPAPAAVQCTSSGSSSVRTEGFTSGLSSPWAMAFLPDNRVLVTQKGGTMVLVSANGATRTPLSWGSPAPVIRDGGQGGLLDVAVDPDFATTPRVYFTYQEPGPNSTSGTAVGRARLQGNSLVDFQRLYQQTPKVEQDGVHFGSRLAFRSDKTLFVSLGDRGQDDPSSPTRDHAQNLSKTLGKVIRINRDGSIPSDNPFQGQSGALPEIWSLGHRNPQGLTYDATSGALWNTEHGPQGGDELNRVLPGANYAWPLRSYGCPYSATEGAGCRVGGGTHLPLNDTTFNEPVTFWAPSSTAPSNVIVYRGSGFPEWNGQLFIGALAGQRLWRVTLNGTAFASCEAMLSSLNQRIRDVRQGPDGWIWVLTDGGEIRRVLR